MCKRDLHDYKKGAKLDLLVAAQQERLEAREYSKALLLRRAVLPRISCLVEEQCLKLLHCLAGHLRQPLGVVLPPLHDIALPSDCPVVLPRAFPGCVSGGLMGTCVLVCVCVSLCVYVYICMHIYARICMNVSERERHRQTERESVCVCVMRQWLD